MAASIVDLRRTDDDIRGMVTVWVNFEPNCEQLQLVPGQLASFILSKLSAVGHVDSQRRLVIFRGVLPSQIDLLVHEYIETKQNEKDEQNEKDKEEFPSTQRSPEYEWIGEDELELRRQYLRQQR